MKKNRLKIAVLIGWVIGFLPVNALCVEIAQIGPGESIINSSIKYSVIGTYNAVFDDYSGQIGLNWANKEIKSVALNINAASIRSNCGWCDKIVRSKQLLHVEEHPQITFRSDEIIRDGDGYQVKGILDLHGEQRELSFPFKVSRVEDQLIAKGQWIIERKEFKIIWNKFLDKGGVLVGNTITVDWEINLPVLN